MKKSLEIVNTKNAILYCRVSSREQTDGYSLVNQIEECRNHARRLGLIVVKEFVNEEGESAKNTNRPALKDLLKFVSLGKTPVSAVLVWKFDRLARDVGDFAELSKFFDKRKIEIISVTEQSDSSAGGKLIRNILGTFAQYENDVKAERTTAGMKRAVQAGCWVWKAPYGYKNVKDALHNTTLHFQKTLKPPNS